MADVASAQPGAGPEVHETNASDFEVRVSAPGAAVVADTILQEAIDKVAAKGGGVVLLGAGDFKLSRRAGMYETVVLKSGVTLRGQGHATHLYLDPATLPQAARYYPVRIGTETTPASNVVVEHLRYTGNNARIGGGSIMGFNARLGSVEARLMTSENVTVRHCWILDAQQAVGCTKEGILEYPSKVRQDAQFKNWQVHHNFIDTCGNKAVEFAECNGGLIADNHIVNVKAGPQVIFGSRNVQIRDNVVLFTDTGINITEGSHHIRVSGNHVEPVADINAGALGPCLIFRTEPQPLNGTISDVVVTGNVFRNQATRAKCVVRFQTRPEALACTYRGVTFTGNVFDGDVHFFDDRSPSKTTIRDIIFADNVCEGDVISVPNVKMMSQHVMVRGNMLCKAGEYVLNADQWVWSGNTLTAGTIRVASGARANMLRDNVTVAPIGDEGVSTIVKDNLVSTSPVESAKPSR
ncbi:right-handed parallel beta-helix repeat-containing protein [Roseimicrobium sp. ORNL1]|uniref:right-handed parallel beta-helix repeat-containing protein n=1 Tax=Roseimicrobium sp. ORNL1 TaxID=2711231 RepID=UPI0013E185BB|nr:right-handed parallel beta-helix repeat-containing protein [Roseimicrobium sp. ORNL1]QIF03137.1 hypothetical protein G5S37_16945 [Roseimicrobium sp. ORNL1]